MSNEVATTKGGAVANRDPIDTKIAKIRTYINENRQKVADACISGVDPERLIRTAVMFLNSREIKQTSKTSGKSVIDCTPASVLKAIIDCARIGLDPSFGRAYIIPYGNEAELQIGYLGLIELAKRSGEIKSIVAGLVHDGDHFVVEVGTHPRFEHRPKFQGNGENFLHVYALAVFDDGRFEHTVLSKADVENVRLKHSKAPTSPAWVKDYGEMAKKCAIRRLCKTLPLTIEAREAIDFDDRRNNVIDADFSVVRPQTARERVDESLGRDKEPEALAAPPAESTEEADDDAVDPDDPDWFAKEAAKIQESLQEKEAEAKI